MNRVVLDASAILAVIGREPGSEVVLEHIHHTVASTVNLAEAQAKLVSRGAPKDEAWEDILSLTREAIAFDSEQAFLAGTLIKQTRSLGLSLGDRACLALCMTLKAPVYTADIAWKTLRLGFKVNVIR